MAEVLEHVLPMKHRLGDLADVKISSPQDGQVPTYVAADKKWENKTPTGGGGGVPNAGDVWIQLVRA
jgi:hypothetical protein